MSKQIEWYWFDFEYKSGKSKLDSRRAAFWLHDFVNEFNIEHFQAVQTDGEWQNARITIVYRMPEGFDEDTICERWSVLQNKWVEKH